MKRIILHMGQTKTGSSALQTFLYNCREFLARQGVCYYSQKHQFNDNPGHPNAGFLGGCDPAFIRKTNGETSVDKLRAEERDHLKEALATSSTILLSDETLFAQSDRFSAMKDFLQETGQEVVIDVVVYLRPQDEWILSAWKQNVNGSTGRRTLKQYMKWAQWALDYRALVERLEQAFSQQHVHIRAYEPESFLGGNLFYDFIASNGMVWEEDFEEFMYIRSNPSITLNTARIKRYLNMLTRMLPMPLKDKMKRRVYQWARKHSERHPEGEKRHILSRAEREALMRKYHEGNSVLARKYLDRNELFLAAR